MNKSKAKKNIPQGVKDVDTISMEQLRQKVVEQELSARSWKAYWEKMHYSLECEKIEPEYKEYQKRAEERFNQETKIREEFFKTMRENGLKISGDQLNVDEFGNTEKSSERDKVSELNFSEGSKRTENEVQLEGSGTIVELGFQATEALKSKEPTTITKE